MRFATLRHLGREQAAVLAHGDRWVPLDVMDPGLAGDLLVLVTRGWSVERLDALARMAEKRSLRVSTPATEANFAPPFRKPRKIWGIGLNYLDHARDLAAEQPSQPASFIKADHTIIGHGDTIVVPPQTQRVTSEAELGIIFGRHCFQVTRAGSLDYLFGVCNILDQTAEDILSENPRYLTRAKNFPTFLSFGPEVVTVDEFLAERSLGDVVVTTVHNGDVVARNTVANMAHGPAELISFHSHLMPFFPADILSSGTPGAAVVEDGSVMSCVIDGLRPLRNPVRRSLSGAAGTRDSQT